MSPCTCSERETTVHSCWGSNSQPLNTKSDATAAILTKLTRVVNEPVYLQWEIDDGPLLRPQLSDDGGEGDTDRQQQDDDHQLARVDVHLVTSHYMAHTQQLKHGVIFVTQLSLRCLSIWSAFK